MRGFRCGRWLDITVVARLELHVLREFGRRLWREIAAVVQWQMLHFC